MDDSTIMLRYSQTLIDTMVALLNRVAIEEVKDIEEDNWLSPIGKMKYYIDIT